MENFLLKVWDSIYEEPIDIYFVADILHKKRIRNVSLTSIALVGLSKKVKI